MPAARAVVHQRCCYTRTKDLITNCGLSFPRAASPGPSWKQASHPPCGRRQGHPTALCHRVLLSCNRCIVIAYRLTQPPFAPFLDVPFKDVTVGMGELEGDRNIPCGEGQDSVTPAGQRQTVPLSCFPSACAFVPDSCCTSLSASQRTREQENYFGTIGGK